MFIGVSHSGGVAERSNAAVFQISAPLGKIEVYAMSWTDPKYRHCLHDVGAALRDRALEASQRKRSVARGSPEYEFASGRLLAFNETISILQQYAEGFAIPASELQLENIEPDRDLI
jgi:hypothetical protein